MLNNCNLCSFEKILHNKYKKNMSSILTTVIRDPFRVSKYDHEVLIKNTIKNIWYCWGAFTLLKKSKGLQKKYYHFMACILSPILVKNVALARRKEEEIYLKDLSLSAFYIHLVVCLFLRSVIELFSRNDIIRITMVMTRIWFWCCKTDVWLTGDAWNFKDKNKSIFMKKNKKTRSLYMDDL